MSARPAGLRLRLFGSLVGAVLLAGALLAVPLLLAVRDSIYTRRIEEARAVLHEVALRSPGLPPEGARYLDASAAVRDGCPKTRRDSGLVILCERLASGGALQRVVRLDDVRAQLVALDVRLLVTLALGLAGLFALLVWLLERGVVRRVLEVDAALARVASGEDEGGSPLPESGDVVGRLGAAVRQLGLRLREERALTAARIAELQGKNLELREAREELSRSERLASVGRLAAGVAHEVGNPITAVIGYAALIKDRLAQGKECNDFVERIEREAARIDRILRDLLDLARPPPALPGAVSLAAVLSEAGAVLQPQLEPRGCSLMVALPQSLPAVQGETHYFVQVFVNLVANSARVGARTVRVTGRAENAAIVVEVRDDGPGIDAAILPRLFEPFFTTAAPGEGTGLGLALCHATMERFGGSIAALRPEDGKGALFELRFARA